MYFLSSQPYEAQTLLPFMREHLSEPAVQAWMPDFKVQYSIYHIQAKEDPFLFLEFIFRKAAHMFVYGTLAAFGYMMLSADWIGGSWKSALILLVAAAAAALDEYNQLFSLERNGSLYDVGIDLAGAALGLLFMVSIQRLKSNRSREERG